MAISPRTARALHEVLGDDAADDFSRWMQDVEMNRAEMRELFELQSQKIAATLDARFADLLDARFAESHRVIGAEIAAVRVEIARVRADLLKWSFVFWVGAVGAIAALAGVLRS